MPRPLTGSIMQIDGPQGTVYGLRFSAYGKRRWINLPARDGWTEETARGELDRIIDEVKAGVWEAPRLLREVCADIIAAASTSELSDIDSLALRLMNQAPDLVEAETHSLVVGIVRSVIQAKRGTIVGPGGHAFDLETVVMTDTKKRLGECGAADVAILAAACDERSESFAEQREAWRRLGKALTDAGLATLREMGQEKAQEVFRDTRRRVTLSRDASPAEIRQRATDLLHAKAA